MMPIVSLDWKALNDVTLARSCGNCNGSQAVV
jgi:hypothetical protein